MWEFIVIFLFTVGVYILFFIAMLFRKTEDGSASAEGHSCGHRCQCSGGHIHNQAIGPMITDKEGMDG
jgi:hypothetical protein